MLKKVSSRKGFTLLEILLVVGIIAILAGIVIIAINPSKQLGDTRNAQRRSDVLTILNAAYQYSIDNNGSVPATIVTTSDVCATGTSREIANASTTGYINLYPYLVGSVAASSTYLVSIPKDPQATSTISNSVGGSGYNIVKTTSNRLTVCAPLAENGVTISVTR